MTTGPRVLGMVLVVWSVLASQATAAPTQASLEYSVKANYLVRFAAFVEWPSRAFSGPQAPVVICVAGRDPFGATLDRAARGQTAFGRSLTVRRPASAEAVAGCHILYVGHGAAALIPQAARRAGLLLVTDSATPTERGMIHFVVADARVRFHIDQAAATRSGLSINSRLLNLALTVRES
ncbi:MAG: YfiR family protein [Brevundimonas sp.]